MKIKKFLVPQNIARRKLESNLVIVSNSLSLLVLVLVPPFEQSFNSDISQILRSTIIRNEYIKIHQDEVFQGSHAATVSHIITSPAYYGQHTRRRRRKHCLWAICKFFVMSIHLWKLSNESFSLTPHELIFHCNCQFFVPYDTKRQVQLKMKLQDSGVTLMSFLSRWSSSHNVFRAPLHHPWCHQMAHQRYHPHPRQQYLQSYRQLVQVLRPLSSHLLTPLQRRLLSQQQFCPPHQAVLSPWCRPLCQLALSARTEMMSGQLARRPSHGANGSTSSIMFSNGVQIKIFRPIVLFLAGPVLIPPLVLCSKLPLVAGLRVP